MTASASSIARTEAIDNPELPAWPLGALFVGYTVWWLLGFGDFSWTLFGIVMLACICRARRWRVPKGFGLVFAFLVWAGLSVIGIDTFGRLLGFVFRYAQYASIAVVFVYVYNARRFLPVDRVLGYLTVFWCWTIVGGYLGLLLPTTRIHTPLSYLLPQGLVSNELVRRMVVLRLSEGYNPDAWVQGFPRPSAPFLYTNNWGNAFSLLLPLVILYISRVGPGWRRRLLMVVLPISMVPAFLTLNRGMFLALAIITLLIAVRFALEGRIRALLALVGAGAIGVVVAWVLPVSERLGDRLEVSGTNVSRISVYSETVYRVLGSPLFGFGAPRPAETSSAIPPAGTQGQVWMVLFSHGFVGLFLFLAMICWMIRQALKWSSIPGVVVSSLLMAFLVEIFYYGVLGAGLCIAFILAAMAMREIHGAGSEQAMPRQEIRSG